MGKHNSITINGNVSGAQFQQDAHNSNQDQTIQTVEESLDWDAVNNLVKDIEEMKHLYTKTFGDKAGEFSDKVDDIKDAANKKDESTAKKVLKTILGLAEKAAETALSLWIKSQLAGK